MPRTRRVDGAKTLGHVSNPQLEIRQQGETELRFTRECRMAVDAVNRDTERRAVSYEMCERCVSDVWVCVW
jgi:hypothetical protein